MATKKKPKDEAKKTAAKPEAEWRTDRPERQGLYNARVNGKEIPLQYKVCQFTGRAYWINIDGTDLDPSAKVEWRDGKVEL